MSYTIIGLITTWVAIFISIPAVGFDVEVWVLIVSASLGGVLSSLFVLLAESVVEDVVKLVMMLVLSGVVWGMNPALGYIFVAVLISGGLGAITNQIGQYAANKRS